jgi:hypothetical protein
MGPFCYITPKGGDVQGGTDGIGDWHSESPVYGLARLMKEFSGSLIPPEDFEPFLGDF